MHTQTKIRKLNDLKSLSKDLMSQIRKGAHLNYELFHLTYSTRTYNKYFISPKILREIVTRTLRHLENLCFNPVLKNCHSNLKDKIFLNFPNILFAHKKSEHDREEHLHQLIYIPRKLIKTLEDIYTQYLHDFSSLHKINITADFMCKFYNGDFFNFLRYGASENFNYDDKPLFGSYIEECSRSYFGNTRDSYNKCFDPDFYISLHETFSKTQNIFSGPPLQEVRNKLKLTIAKHLDSNEKKIVLIKAEVGTGKSYSINDLPNQYPGKKILVLVKRRDNFQQYSNFTKLPHIPAEVEKYLEDQNLESLPTYSFLKDLKETTAENIQIKQEYESYRRETEEILGRENFIVATHAKYFYSDLHVKNFDIIIFDECLIDTLVETFPVSIQSFSFLKKFGISSESDFFRQLESLESETAMTNEFSQKEKNLITKTINEIAEKALETNEPISKTMESELKILEYLTKKFHIIKEGNEFHLIRQNSLPTNQKILILSATAPVDYYKEYFKDEIQIEELEKPKLLATIRQDTSRDFSKTDLKDPLKREEALAILIHFSEKGYNTISHKELGPDFHFHAISSVNELENTDLFVLCTPYLSPLRYNSFLLAIGIKKLISFSFNQSDYTDIEYEEEEQYHFKVSEDSKINSLYFSFAKAELIQAIGRERPYEFRRKIIVFSRLMLKAYAYLIHFELPSEI